MSLRVWLPLNGTLENKGLDDITPVLTGAVAVDNEGKIGKCYKFGTSLGRITIPPAVMRNYTECSVTFWVNILGWQTNWDTFFQAGLGSTPWNSYIFGVLRNSGNSVVFTISDASSSSQGNYKSSDLTLNTWYHLGFTYKSGHCCIYVNGNLYKDYSTNIIPNFSGINYISLGQVGNASSYQTNCKMNDFRVYNHALSPLEVKHISQGLILHYPLNNVIGGLSRLWSLASYTRSIDLTTSYAYVYSIPGNTVWLTPGKQYTVAAEIKVNQNNILFCFDSNCSDANGVYSGNDAAQTVQYNPTINLEKDKWVPVYITTTIKNDAGKPYYHHGFLFRTNSGTLTTNCEIRNIEVYEGDLKLRRGLLPIDTTEYDCSGYGNNGTRMGTFSWTSNTPKYMVSQVFNGTNNAIQTPSLPSMITDKNYTIAVWIYKTVIGSKSYQTIYGGPSGFEIEARNGGANETKFVPWNWGKPMASYELNEWNHCVFVHSDFDCKIYLNGEYIATGSAKAANPSGNYFVGAWNTATQQNFDGLMSDFRIYATALSAEDVKSLYQNSAYIDNQGNIYGAVYEEV